MAEDATMRPFQRLCLSRFRDGCSIYVTLINKSYGDHAQSAPVVVKLLPDVVSGTWQRLDLVQQNQDVSAKTGVTLGGAFIDSAGSPVWEMWIKWKALIPPR